MGMEWKARMIKLIGYTLLLAALSGCASMGESKGNNVTQWMQATYPQVKAGNMKESEYYKQLFNKLLADDYYRKNTSALNSASMMIDASTQYERGEITVDQYKSLRRKALIVANQETPEVNTRSSSTNLDYLLIDPPQVNCNSYNIGDNTYTYCR